MKKRLDKRLESCYNVYSENKGIVMKDLIEESKQESMDECKTYWAGSYFEFLKPFSLDERGKWGERLIYKLLQSSGSKSYWDGDNNTDPVDGIYDIWVLVEMLKKRVEVKTAMRGTLGESWQHEHVYGSPDIWDKLVFLDLDYDRLYLTVFDYEDMVWDRKNPITGRKPTLRKDSKNSYKVDMGGATLIKTLSTGYTFRHVLGEDQTLLADFLRNKIEK